eukprot:g12337.t1
MNLAGILGGNGLPGANPGGGQNPPPPPPIANPAGGGGQPGQGGGGQVGGGQAGAGQAGGGGGHVQNQLVGVVSDLVDNPPLTEQETSAHANAYNDAPSKLCITSHEFRAVNDTIRKRAFHSNARNVQIEEQGGPGKGIKFPITFLRTAKALTVDGRAGRTLTDVQFGVLRDGFETLCDRIPEGHSKEVWEAQLEEFCWQVVYEKARDKVGDRMVGGVPTTYQNRLAAMFNVEFLTRLRSKVDTFSSTSACINLMIPPGFPGNPAASYGPVRRQSQTSMEASSPFGAGFVPQQQVQGQQMMQNNQNNGGGQQMKPKLPQVCWHYLKRTPCLKPVSMGANGIQCCEHGMHPLKGQLDVATFQAIKKSKYGRKQLKQVDYESWLCLPVPVGNSFPAQAPQPMRFGFGLNNAPAPQQQQVFQQPQFQMPTQQQAMQMPTAMQQQQGQFQQNPMMQMFQNLLQMQQQQRPR